MARSTRRVRRTPEQVAQIVREFHESGLTRAEFAKRVGVHPTTVGYWLRDHPAETRKPELIPVRLKQGGPEVSIGAGIEVIVRDDLRIRVEPGFHRETLLDLLATLQV